MRHPCTYRFIHIHSVRFLLVCLTGLVGYLQTAYSAEPIEKRITVSLPTPPVTGWRFYDHQIATTLTVAGNVESVRELVVSLYPNHGNHPSEAETSPLADVTVALKSPGAYEVKFDKVPFGMYTLRVTAKDRNGSSALVLEELVSMIHHAPPQAAADAWVWGLDSHADRNDRRYDIDLPSLREAGANWSRMEFLWRDITDENGTPNFSHHDIVVNEAAKYGIHYFGLLNTTAKHAELVPGADWGSPPKLDAWEQWCRQVFTHFKGRITHYEIWNEPDGYAFWWFAPGVSRPEYHTKLVKIAARVAREISPDIKIMAPSLTPIGRAYLRQMIEAGAFDEIDILSCHSATGRHPKSFWKQLLSMLKQRYPDRTFSVWSTESAPWCGLFLANFAETSPQAYFHYVDRDKGTDPGNAEHNNGLVKNNGTPKDAYIRFQNLAARYSGSQYIGRALSGRDVQAYLFRRDGVYTLAVWTQQDVDAPTVEKQISLPELKNTSVEVFDALGNPVSPDRGIHLVGFDPVSVVHLPAENPLVLDACVNCLDDYTKVSPTQPVELNFTFYNPTGKTVQYELSLAPPKNWNCERTQIRCTVEPGKILRETLKAELDRNSDSGDSHIDATLTVNGHTIPKRFGPFWIENPLRIHRVRIDDFEKGNHWITDQSLDIHSLRSDEGVARKANNLQKLTREVGVRFVSAPVRSGRKAGRFSFAWNRPETGWSWMAANYLLRKPVSLPGIPTEIRFHAYMKNPNVEFPITVLAKFIDSTGQHFHIEGGGEIYWSGWREFSIVIPSFLGEGYIHSWYGDVKDKQIHYPLKFEGLVLNLPPARFIANFPPDKPEYHGFVVIDDIEIDYYKESSSR